MFVTVLLLYVCIFLNATVTEHTVHVFAVLSSLTDVSKRM